jgi:hypothetical protein
LLLRDVRSGRRGRSLPVLLFELNWGQVLDRGVQSVVVVLMRVIGSSPVLAVMTRLGGRGG